VSKSKPSETRKSRKARTAPHQHTYDTLLSLLIKAREESGMTQREVSAALGMSHSFLSKCETGERSIDVIDLLQLARLYGKPIQHFFPEIL
jgi:transcriptional regulator with XRE-family HTH domain